MAVARTGSALRQDSSANSGSASVTVPVDTVGVLMLAAGWPDAGTTFFTGAAFTLDGVAFELVDGEHADGSHNNSTAWAITDYTGDTGSQTFAWDWGGASAPAEGMSMFLIFLTADSPENLHVKSFGGAAAESSSGSTGAMDADTGDYAAAVSSHSGSASFTGATELFDATFNGAVQALAEQASPSGPVTISVSASDFVAITGLVISDEEPPPPPPWTRYTVNDNGTLAWSTVDPDAGDLVIVLFANDGGDDQSTPSAPEGLTRFDPGNVGSSVEFGAYYRICDGTETGNIVSTAVASAADGFNVNTEEYGCHVFHIPAANWHGTTPPELARSTAASGTPNAPALNPSGWDTEATLWIVALTRDDDDGISSVGSDYADNFLRTNSSSNGPEIATSGRVNEAASEDPGASTVTGTAEEYIIYTIGVRPAGAASDPIDLDHLDASPTFHTLAVGAVHIDLTHLDASATFFAPSLVGGIDLDVLDASPTFHALTLAAPTEIDLDHLDASPTFHTIAIGAVHIDLAHLDASPTFHTPSLVGLVDLTHLDASPTFHAPALAAAIALDHLDAGPTFHTPQIVGEGIQLDHLDASATFHLIAVGAIHIDLDHLDAGPTFHVLAVLKPVDHETGRSKIAAARQVTTVEIDRPYTKLR